jgi:hypothetical protein
LYNDVAVTVDNIQSNERKTITSAGNLFGKRRRWNKRTVATENQACHADSESTKVNYLGAGAAGSLLNTK